jgi:hypothetical protein
MSTRRRQHVILNPLPPGAPQMIGGLWVLKECDRTQYLCIAAGVCNGNTEGHVMSPYQVGARDVVKLFKRPVRVCRSGAVFRVEFCFTS